MLQVEFDFSDSCKYGQILKFCFLDQKQPEIKY